MVKITRGVLASNADGGVLPWSFARTEPLRALMQQKSRAFSAEVNEAAGLEWRVYQAPPFVFVGGQPSYDEQGVVAEPPPAGHFKLIRRRRTRTNAPEPAYYLNVRDDTDEVIGIVKKRYRILQNEQAPRVLDHVVSIGELRYEAAGALHGGAHVFWLATLPPNTFSVQDAGALQTYVLVTNSFDGSTSLTAAILSVHAATQTTLTWPLATAPRTLAIRHTDSGTQALEAKRVLELATGYRNSRDRLAEQLVATRLTERQFGSFIEAVVPSPQQNVRHDRVVNQRGITMAENTKALIAHVYFHNESLQALHGTLLGAVLACQYYADHMAISRNTDDATAEENRFKRLTSERNLGSSAFVGARQLLG